MHVLILSTSDSTGGAAIAAQRLYHALRKNGVKVTLMVADTGKDKNVGAVRVGRKWQRKWCFIWERLIIFFHKNLSRRQLFDIDIANVGIDITSRREFHEADVIHFHWINQGFLSIKGMQKILSYGKPAVATMHDLWYATSICHYPNNCSAYTVGCKKCPLLPKISFFGNLSKRVWKCKQKLMRGQKVAFVACSEWLNEQVRKSVLLKGQVIMSIPNPIDTSIFRLQDANLARKNLQLPLEKRIILFAAQRATDSRKGVAWLEKAIEILAKDNKIRNNTCIAILGSCANELQKHFSIQSIPLGYVSNYKILVQAYNAADVFVLPSLQENLPNTIMESMACGTPCVGFRVGGIPEMIEHRRTGYVAEYCNAEDLAKGIKWILYEADTQKMREEALKKVNTYYSEQVVAEKYIEIYNRILNE